MVPHANYKQVMVPGIILYILCIMLTSICTKYVHFMIVQGVIGGLANGMVMNPSVAATAQYFHKNRGAAMGLAIAGSSLGGVIFPLALTRMLENPALGFGWTVRVCGFMNLALLTLGSLLIKARLPPRQNKFFIPGAFTEPTYLLVIASGFIVYLGMFSPYFFLPGYALSHGMNPQLSSYLIAILNGAGFPGRVIPGILSDKLGRFNMFALAGLVSAILLFCWTQCTTDSTIIVFTVLYGFASGGIISGFSVSLASSASDAKNIGTYMGQGATISALASLIGPPVNGAFLANYQSFNQLAIFSAVACIVGSGMALAAKATTKAGLFGVA